MNGRIILIGRHINEQYVNNVSCTSREEETALPAWNWLEIKIEKGRRARKDYVICHIYHPIIDKNPGTYVCRGSVSLFHRLYSTSFWTKLI